MFYATVCRLIAKNDGELPANVGKAAHATFLTLVHSVDTDLSERLHTHQGRQPFTVSPLMGSNIKPGRTTYIKAGREVYLRFTLLDAAMFQVVAQHLLQGGSLPSIRLGPVHFSIVQAMTTLGSHPRAGYASASNMLENWQQRPTPDTLTLRFLTPTAITRKSLPNKPKQFWQYPEPTALWHNLRRQWGQRGGDDPGKPYDDWVENNIAVIKHNLHTQLWHFGRYDQVGFVGQATFKCMSKDEEARQLWHALADFGFYAGVGYKTTMGMGQVEVGR